jgi:serine/threonine protein kinase
MFSQYAPKEVLEGNPRSRSQDIFSLGCCFIEIFIGYKGKQVGDLWGPIEAREGQRHPYAYHIPEILDWLKANLVEEKCDAQLWNLIRQMVASDREARPTAHDVWTETVVMKSSSQRHFCGACCLPILSDTLPAMPPKPPSSLSYQRNTPKWDDLANADAEFSTYYHTDNDVPYISQRILRIVNQGVLDAVGSNVVDILQCRKTIWPRNETESEKKRASEVAKKEAEILVRLHKPKPHPHIVKLAGTYSQKRSFALLITPTADCDLKTYLSWVEPPRNLHHNAQGSREILRKAFGCLAHTVNHLHNNNIVHGDIESRNILVMESASQYSKICLAEFGMAAAVQLGKEGVLGTYHDPHGDYSSHTIKVRSPFVRCIR